MIQNRYAILFDYVACSGGGAVGCVGPRGDEAADPSGGETPRCGFQPTMPAPNSVAAVDSSSR